MLRASAIVMAALLLAGCGAGERLTLGERTEFIVHSPVPEPPDWQGVALLDVASGQPMADGTPYYVTLRFGPTVSREVSALDSAGGEHQSNEPCEAPAGAECLVFVVPPGTVLVGLTLDDTR